mmetsp:Transcript_26959/g.39667  ORF Transcript_26959/g.39667 Transcript_26959/m.39667 type:complete len:316 (+) Transcript_26959:376-1323(+)
MATSTSPSGLRLIDTCVNLQDTMFQGIYNDKQKHEPDWESIKERAAVNGVEKMIGVSGSLEDSRQSLAVAQQNSNIFSTVGVHPTRCNEFEESGDAEAHLEALAALVGEGGANVVAIGEIGLDYDREHFCARDVQMKFFERQLDLAKRCQLPVIFHNRNTNGDFEEVVKRRRGDFTTGIVHSFTGTREEMLELCALGLYIGINGCGLRTQELLDMVAAIPMEKLVVETDAPWCGIKASHASSAHVSTKFAEVKKEKFVLGCMVKDRNEPAKVLEVVEVIASIKGVDVSIVAQATYQNTLAILFSGVQSAPIVTTT